MRARTGVVMLGLLIAAPVTAQQTQLSVDRPLLLECGGRPCFRIGVVAKNENGDEVDLPSGTNCGVSQGDRALPNVISFARKIAGKNRPAPVRTPRLWFVLLDTSGSMTADFSGVSRFEAARTQLVGLLDVFVDNVDQMIVAQFDTRNVAQRIADAPLLTTREALRNRIAQLDPPSSDTALYFSLYETLRRVQTLTGPARQVSVVVFTDGKNDLGNSPKVRATIPEVSLEKIVDAVKTVGVNVFTLGIGSPGKNFDEAALKALAYPDDSNYFNAQDTARLKKIFGTISTSGASAVHLLVGPLDQSRDELQSVTFKVVCGSLSRESPQWRRPELTASASVEGTLSAEEKAAVSKWKGLTTQVKEVSRMLVLAAYAALLAVLWFGLPRVVWPDRYVPKPAMPAGKAGQRPAGKGGAPRPPSPGGRPEVSLPPNRPATGGSMRPPTPDRLRDAGPPPARDRVRDVASQPAAKPPEALGERAPSDPTVFIPPKKPGHE